MYHAHTIGFVLSLKVPHFSVRVQLASPNRFAVFAQCRSMNRIGKKKLQRLYIPHIPTLTMKSNAQSALENTDLYRTIIRHREKVNNI
jgi:hypothetical protein